MKTNVLLKATAFFAAVLLMSGCIFDSLQKPEDKTSEMGTAQVSLSGGASENGLQTKISLEQNQSTGAIDLFWQEGDKVNLLVVQTGSDPIQYTATVEINTSNPKIATFNYPLPDGEANFALYGVYGGEIDEDGKVTLPAGVNPTSSNLRDLQNNKAIVLVFSKTGIQKSSPNLTGIEFQHIGSLFSIKLKNTSTSAASETITQAELETTEPTTSAYGADFIYDITNGSFDDSKKTKTMTFSPAQPATIDPEGILEFWAWVPMVAGEWASPKLKVVGYNNPDAYDNKEVAPGKAYYLYAKVNGESSLAIAAKGEMSEPSVKDGYDRMTDPRDGTVYRIVEIDGRTWLAENLRYLPKVNEKGDPAGPSGDKTSYYQTLEPRYYVYGYNGEVVTDAKNHTEGGVNMYQTYGVLYNWPAVMDGVNTPDSKTNPSGVQGVCPPGWHVPSSPEWVDMQVSLGMNRVDAEKRGNRTFYGGEVGVEIAKKLKEVGTDYWSSNDGASNSSGFSARAGGMRAKDGNFKNIKNSGFWWTASVPYSDFDACHRELAHNQNGILRDPLGREYAISVRCVKDF